MLDIDDKSDNTAGTTGELTAAEYNDHKNEIQDSIKRSGQVLNIGKTPFQMGRAMMINGVGAQSVQDSSGTANSIILSPITGANGLIFADNYNQLNGAIFEFEKPTANTSTSVTINIGQTGTELGVKNLVKLNGQPLTVGEVEGYIRVKYDLTGDQWLLVSPSEQTRGFAALSKTRAMLSWYEVQNLGNSIDSTTFGNNLYLSGLSNGDIWKSIDGSTWGLSQNLGSPVKSLSFGNGVYIAGTSNGDIYNSIDGDTWQISQNISTFTVTTLYFNDNIYIAGLGNGEIWTSSDALSWSLEQDLGTSINAITYSNTLYVAGNGSGEIWTSSDSLSWTIRQDLGATSISSLASNDNIYIAGLGNGEIWTSSDALSWSLEQDLGTSAILTINYNLDLFIAGLINGDIFTSSMGKSWTLRQNLKALDVNSISFGNDKFIAGLDGGGIWTPDVR